MYYEARAYREVGTHRNWAERLWYHVYKKYSIKSQALVNFIVEYSDSPNVIDNENVVEVCNIEVKKAQTWHVFMDGAYNFKRVELGVVILDLDGNYFKHFVRMDYHVTNNVANTKWLSLESWPQRNSEQMISYYIAVHGWL